MSDCRHNAPNREPEAGDVQTQRQQLDEQSREALVDRLVDCLYSFEGEEDIEALDRCLEGLEMAGAVCEDFDVEQGLKDFHERFSDAFESSPQEVKKLPGAIARWTSEQFSFVKEGEEKGVYPSLPYASLHAALDDWGVVDQLAPNVFPEGIKLSDIMVKESKESVLFSASYVMDEKTIFISLRKVVGVPYGEIEINDPSVEIYEAGGIKHHLMSDVKQRKATWYNGEWECYIAGDLSRGDLLMMIDSIYQ